MAVQVRAAAGRKADDEAQRTIGEIHGLRADIRCRGQRQSGETGERGAAANLHHENYARLAALWEETK